MATTITRPRVFMDIQEGTEPIGRIVIELFIDKAPKTVENFRQLCTGRNHKSLSYKFAPFHRIIDEFMIQGGDITKGDGTGGDSIYGGEFADENIGWRDIDASGLVCMANRGPDTNSSQFFITLADCSHLNNKHTVFGHIVSGQNVLERMSKADTDRADRPKTDIIIAHCGELEKKKKAPDSAPIKTVRDQEDVAMTTSSEHERNRGRRKRRHSQSPTRSPSPSRGHGRKSAERHRHHHRKHHHRSESSSPSASEARRRRRNSDASTDHTRRGRGPRRSRTRSPIPEEEEGRRHERRRSQPPSRSGRKSPDRRRSPRWRRDQDRDFYGRGYDDRWKGERWERSGRDGYGDAYRRDEGRLGGEDGRLGGDDGRLGGGYDDEAFSGDGVKYKGRGYMKYRENGRASGRGGRRW